MKRLFKKNQIIITTLAIMIAVAGYLNYSGRIFGESGKAEATNGELANQELLDITSEDGAQETAGDIESQDQEVADGTVEGTPGEAVLTNGDVTGVVAEAKVTREQVRAKNKETLLEIIDNANLSDEQKQDAINQMIAMTELAEKEAAVELMRAFGKTMRETENWKTYVISSLENFENVYGKRADKRRRLYNGMIPCQLYMYL